MPNECRAGLLLDSGRGAVISSCGRYRYRLWREWDSRPRVTFVMLNPSTADANEDDPTIRRCIGFASRWGFGGLEVVNCFALRSSDPALLRSSIAPVSEPGRPERNRDFVIGSHQRCSMTIAAWGREGVELGVHDETVALLKASITRLGGLFALGFNQDGSPKHPLYVPYETVPVLVP